MATANKVLIHTNGAMGNEVMTFNRGSDGRLTFSAIESTAGKGGSTGGGDPLESQGSLAYDPTHDLVFAVNAGNNFLSVLHFSSILRAVNIASAAAFAGTARAVPAQPAGGVVAQPSGLIAAGWTNLFARTLHLQSMMTSGGSFPVSVAVSGTLVYLLNAKGSGSIQGYRIQSDSSVAPLPGSHRDLGLASNSGTPGQIRFCPDGKRLVISTKANGNKFIVFTLDPATGLPSTSGVSSNSQRGFPFGFTFDSHGYLVATEVGGAGVGSYSLGANGTLTPKDFQASGSAACWVEHFGGHCYVANNSAGTVTVHTLDANGMFGVSSSQTVGGAPIDLAISSDGKFVYVQTAQKQVQVFPVNADGSLAASIQTVTDPKFAEMEGIVAT